MVKRISDRFFGKLYGDDSNNNFTCIVTPYYCFVLVQPRNLLRTKFGVNIFGLFQNGYNIGNVYVKLLYIANFMIEKFTNIYYLL